MTNNLEANKEVVRRFNREVIEQCSREALDDILREDFINHTAAPNVDKGKEGIWFTFHEILHPMLSNIKVEIYEQVAEGDLVTTRKAITGKHTGTIADIPATGKEVKINVIDIVKIQDGKYAAHWGINNLQAVLAELKK